MSREQKAADMDGGQVVGIARRKKLAVVAGFYPSMQPDYMKTETNVKWTFGNFDVSLLVSAEVEGKAAAGLLEAAALNVLQRKPCSDLEKLLAGYDKRPAGFNRGRDIPYSEEGCAQVADFFESYRNGLFVIEDVAVEEHVGGEASPMRMAEAFCNTMIGAGKRTDLVNLLNTLLGVQGSNRKAGEESSFGTLVELAHACKLGQRK